MSELSIWNSVDPLAGKYPSNSPYMYVLGNPVHYTDPDGRWVKGAGFFRNIIKSDQRIKAENLVAKHKGATKNRIENGWRVTWEEGDKYVSKDGKETTFKAWAFADITKKKKSNIFVGDFHDYKGVGGVGLSFEIAFPKFVTKNVTHKTGIGLDFGFLRDKKGLGLYATTKSSTGSGIACSIQAEIFAAESTAANPNKITKSDLRGPGYEFSVGLGPVGGSYSGSNAPGYGKRSNYYMLSVSAGVGIDAGFVNWNTKTYISGK